MVKKIINIGIEGNDATGDPIRDAFEKTNENFNELYSFFGKGDGIRFTDLTDYDTNRNGELLSQSVFIVNNSGDPNIPGSKILAKTLEGDGIEIINTDPEKITFKNLGSKLLYDPAPTLGAPLNAQNNLIYNLKDPSNADAAGLGISLDVFAATRGFVGSNFVELSGDNMRGPLTVPAGATDTQVPRRNEVVGISGDTMTGPLKLSRNPVPSDDTDYDGLIAATKNYVDTTSFSSQVNLFVSTSGDDFRFEVPETKRGSALAYAFKTINRACWKAEQLMKAAAIELGPYQKPIFFNNGNGVSVVSSTSTAKADGITYTLTITNGGQNLGTDMRGTGINSVATIDVRAGLIIRGTESGALAMITVVNSGLGAGTTIRGITYGGTETYDILFKNFQDEAKTQPIAFIQGEPLEYSDGVQKLNISIFVESGEYYENYPIRVPANVTIIGDDTRRVIIRPKTGPSGSIWSNTYFRRDPVIDGLNVTQEDPVTHVRRTFGYHYLSDSSKIFYNNTVDNPIHTYNPVQPYSTSTDPRFLNVQKILNTNKKFFQDEILAWVNLTYPGEYSLSLQNTWYKNIGAIVNAIQFDILYGGHSRILESAMSFFSNTSDLKEITGGQLTKTVSMINRLNQIIILVLENQTISNPSPASPPVLVITPESGFDLVINSLIKVFKDIIQQDALVNFPKNNDQMDVFLLNDANRIRTISCQGHGGFMAVLDPAGQILTKSPYVFQCSSFSKSINNQQFAGGMFVDAFTGNLQCTILLRSSSTVLKVGGLTNRVPTNIPVSFVVNGIRFEVDYIDQSTGYSAGQYNLYLNTSTPDDITYTGLGTQLSSGVIELQTAGNRSMLCSDFTQINDLGYGIMATNGAFIEAVSIFTYYCYRGFYSLNGSQIRSLNGSCAYGTYALNSEGSDPTEVSTTSNLKYPMIQILTTYSTDTLSGKNLKDSVSVYVKISKNRLSQYIPFPSSELEIDHGGSIGVVLYLVSNCSYASLTIDNDEIWYLILNTSGNYTGLKNDVNNGTAVIVRNLQNFDVIHLPIINQSRPSTALQFNNDYRIYHLSSYATITQTITITSVANTSGVLDVANGGTVGLKAGQQVVFTGIAFGGISINTTYYIVNVINSTITISAYPGLSPVLTTTVSSGNLSGTVGGLAAKDLSATLTIDNRYSYISLQAKSGTANVDSNININVISILDRSKIVGMIFAWGTTIHKITGWSNVDTSTDNIVFTTVLSKDTKPQSYNNVSPTLKAGLSNLDSTGAQQGLFINSKISVMRASSHDLVDIGTGGFTNSNIPANIYGAPANPKQQANEVQEIGRGRVFYSSTDQDGNFKVGKYFQVDQGTGSVTFAANISISNVDGLGFSRGGVTVKEFAPDDTMSNQASDTVPTQSAVVGYVNKRLGITYPGNTATAGMLGPGFLSRDGTTSFGYNDPNNIQTLNMNTHRITSLGNPSGDYDATNKLYVDTFFKRSAGIRKSIDGFTMSDKTTFIVYSVSRTNGVATVILRDDTYRSGVHGLSVGSKVFIDGADIPNIGFNGEHTVTSVLTSNGYTGSIGNSICIGFTFDNPINNNASNVFSNADPTLVSATVTTDSHISMSGAKITNVLTPTDVYDAANKSYVDYMISTKDQLSELNDVALTTPTSLFDGQPLLYNFATSKWVNTRLVDQSKLSMRLAKIYAAKPSGLVVTAGNFIIGKTYIIFNTTGTSNDQWNIIAGTTNVSYVNGSIFTAITIGVGTGTATEDVQANSGLASFNKDHFNVDSGFITLADNGITLGKLAKMSSGYLLGNTGTGSATPAEVTFPNALNAALTIPAGLTRDTIPAGVIVKASDASFSTILYDIDVTNNALVRRDNAGSIKVTAVSATGQLGGSSVSVSGKVDCGSVVATGIISAKTELQIDTKKIFDYNGGTTQLWNQFGGKVADFTGSLSTTNPPAPITPSGNLYGTWNIGTITTTAITTGAAATAGTIIGNWSLGSGSQLRATYADLAEYYTSDNDYSPGTVVMIGGDRDVTLARGYGNTAVAGVVSENPAYVMNSDCSGIRVAVALQGRVPCKVVGTIKKGDLLVISQVGGAATSNKDPKPGSIIGKALENYDSDRIGMIEVLVGKH